METEYTRKQFYEHLNYPAIYYTLYVALEEWIAASIFRGDLSRIFLSSPSFCYRRRFELIDAEEAYDDIKIAGLDFPFASYWPNNSGWMPSDWIAGNQAALIFSGIPHFKHQLRAMMVENTIPILFQFEREDDARLAYERLLWLSYRERRESTSINWKEEKIGIPLNIKIVDLEFNPGKTEKEWLEKQRIFLIEANFRIRSFILKPEHQPPLGDLEDYDFMDEEGFYFTEEVILDLMARKKLLTSLSVKTMMNYNPEVRINKLAQKRNTKTTATIEWDVEEDLERVIIHVDGRDPIIVSGDLKEYKIKGLQKDSEYAVAVTFESKEGISKTKSLLINTERVSTKDDKKGEKDTLVGTTW